MNDVNDMNDIDYTNDMNDAVIESLDEQKVAYLIGYNEETNNEEKFATDFETLKKLSTMVNDAVASDSNRNKYFNINITDNKDQTNELPTSTAAKWISEYVNHYSKVNYPPIIPKHPLVSTKMSDAFKLAFENMNLSEQQKQDEINWAQKKCQLKIKYALEIMKACYYLGMNSALCFMAANIATRLKTISPEEADRILFGGSENNINKKL